MLAMFFRILTALLGSVTPAPVDATSLPVIDAVVGERYLHATAEFAISEETGRAWVEATIDNGGQGEDYDSYTSRAKVKNLSYEAQTQEIVYSDKGVRVICAKVTLSKGLFARPTDIRSTAGCKLLARFEWRKDDDGFEYQRRKHLVVELKITR
jgi:hypothetical protein